MIVNQENKKFKPVTIVLEDRYELDSIMEALKHYRKSWSNNAINQLYNQLNEVDK